MVNNSTGLQTTALLIRKEDLQSYLEAQLKDEQEIVNDLGQIIPFIKNEALRKSLVKRQTEGLEYLVGLKAGYVPVMGARFGKTDTKAKWQKRWVDQSLASMPTEVKEVWEKVKAQGLFDSFSVTIYGGGDPLLVGNIGRKHFFIAGWLPIGPKVSLGIRIRMP